VAFFSRILASGRSENGERIETPADNRSYQQQDKTGNDSRNSSRRHNFWL